MRYLEALAEKAGNPPDAGCLMVTCLLNDQDSSEGLQCSVKDDHSKKTKNKKQKKKKKKNTPQCRGKVGKSFSGEFPC